MGSMAAATSQVNHPMVMVPMPMARPRTARAGEDRHQLASSSGAGPETIRVDDDNDNNDDATTPRDPQDQASGEPDEQSLEEKYIQQLKQEIITLQLVLQQPQPQPLEEDMTDGSSGGTNDHDKTSSDDAPRWMARTTCHNHVTNVLAMRQTRGPNCALLLPTSNVLPEPIRVQLLRYNFSHDRAQLIRAKRKLEQLLAESLNQVIDKHLVLEAPPPPPPPQQQQPDHDPVQETDRMDQPHERQRELHENGASHGHGTSLARGFTKALLQILKRSETLKKRATALVTDNKLLLDQLQQSQRETHKLEEQVDLFKDVLARTKESELATMVGPQVWQRLQATWRHHSLLAPDQHAKAPAAPTAAPVGSEENDTKCKLETQIQQLQLALQETQRNCHQLQHTLDDERHQTQVRLHEMECQLQQEQAHGQEQYASAIAQAANELETATNALTRERDHLLTRNESLDQSCRHKDDEIAALQHQIHEMVAHRTIYESEKLQCQTRLDLLHQQLTQQQRLTSHQRHELDQSQQELHETTRQLAIARHDLAHALESVQVRERVLEQTAHHHALLQQELDRKNQLVQHHESQLQNLESRLNQSILVQDQQARLAIEDTWHQKLAAVQHLLEREQQTMALWQEQHTQSLAHEKEKADHAIARAHALQQELDAANLCLAERKKQLDKDQEKFAQQSDALARQLRELAHQNDRLEAQVKHHQSDGETQTPGATAAASSSSSDNQHQQHQHEHQQHQHQHQHQHQQEIQLLNAQLSQQTCELQHKTHQLELLQDQLHHLTAELEQLRAAAASATASPTATATTTTTTTTAVAVAVVVQAPTTPQKGSQTPRTTSNALAEARAELQKAKAKLAALEDHKDKCDSARTKELDQKLKALASKERRHHQELQAFKRQRNDLVADQKTLQEAQHSLHQNAQVFQQVVHVLLERLTSQMRLLAIVPKPIVDFKQQQQQSQQQQQPAKLLAHSSSSSCTVAPAAPGRLTRRPSTASAMHHALTMMTANNNNNNNNNMMMHSPSASSCATLSDFLSHFQTEHVAIWRDLQIKWQQLQSEMDDRDWQLVELRDRLQQLTLNHEEVTVPLSSASTASASASTSGSTRAATVDATGVSPHPFSDAIANGQSTLSVAKQLTLSLSRKSLALHSADKDNEKDRQQPQQQQQEEKPSGGDHPPQQQQQQLQEHPPTVTSLRKEMAELKASYESRVEELNSEIRKIQKLRVDTCQRLRNELSDQKQTSQHLIAMLNEKCTSLEARLVTLQRAYYQLQDKEIELLERYADTSDETVRREILHSLFELISNSCREEMVLRSARRQQRLEKLQHSYCGASSVKDPRDEKTQIV